MNRPSFFESRRAAVCEEQSAHRAPPSKPAAPERLNSLDQRESETDAAHQHALVAPRWALEDLILASETRNEIVKASAAYVERHTLSEWLGKDVLPHVLFHGPPGCGKTASAHALARLIGLPKVLEVNYAAIQDSRVGGTLKQTRSLLAQTRKENCLLFFDEADAILGSRIRDVRQANDQYLNETRNQLLIDLERHPGLVVFCTNLPQNLDSAFARRIPFHVPFALPDKELRASLWSLYLRPTLPREAGLVPGELAALSDGFSPADIESAVWHAAVAAVERRGPQRLVTMEDCRTSIAKVRDARRPPEPASNPPRLTVREVAEGQLPDLSE